MGSSCSSLKKKDRERSSSNEGQQADQRKSSNRSSDSVPYGKTATNAGNTSNMTHTATVTGTISQPVVSESSPNQATSLSPSQSLSPNQPNGETRTSTCSTPIPAIITPSPHPPSRGDNPQYLGVGSTSASPCPSSQSPSPNTTPYSSSKQHSHQHMHSPSLSEIEARSPSYTQLFPIKNDHCHLIAISFDCNELTVWNIYDEKPVRTLKGVSQPKDVKMIDRFRALVLCNRELKLYNLDDGTLTTKLKGVMNQKMPYYGLHDENYVVALSRNRMYVNFMNLSTGDLVTTFKVGEDRFLNSLLVSANGKICVCGDETQKPSPLLVWDLTNRKLIYDLRIPHHEFITRLAAISDDGHYVVLVCKELNTSAPNFIIAYDLENGTFFKKWKPECDSHSVAIASQRNCVINGLENHEVLVWDLTTGNKRYTLTGHSAPPDVLQTTDEGELFLSYDSTGTDKSVRVWSLETGVCEAVFTPEQEMSCCRITPDGNAVVFGYVASLQLQTQLLCKDKNIEEIKNHAQFEIFGDTQNEGKVFDLSKE